jgi:hypothetical protein
VAGLRDQPYVYYFGGTGGGIWKTTDGGIRWSNVSDGQLGTGSVGAVAVAESDTNVVYAGMGEGCIRGNVSHGDGVYRSTDGGQTWTNVGLRDTRQIGRIRVHPKDADTVYVAALGHAFGKNAERGVFRSATAGAPGARSSTSTTARARSTSTWIPPTRASSTPPSGRWCARPGAWRAAGPAAASTRRRTAATPGRRWRAKACPRARGAAWASPSRPRTRAGCGPSSRPKTAGVYRSDDAGATWKRTNNDRRLRQRAWYYTHIFADPKNADSMYVLNTGFYRSQDGGRTFNPIRVPHGDNHDLWIAPDDPLRMIESNDGGANVSFDGGRSWSRQDNQPTAQMYHVITDTRFPYWVYGAQQDNTTVALASASNEGGLDRTQWYPVGGCESGYIAPSPADPQVVYAGCYGGQITRYDHRTGQERDVTVWPENPMGWGAEGMKYRFQWTFPIVFSPHDPKVLYTGGDRVFRTTDEGQTWEAISGDLTRHDAAKLGSSGRTDHQGQHQRRVLRHRVRAGGVAAGEGRPLGRIRRRPRPRLALTTGKTWTNVTPREMPEWSLGQPDRRLHASGRYGLRGHHALQARRLQALRVGHHGLRQDLAPHHRRPARDVLRARGARGSGAARPALRGDGDGRVRLLRRRRALAAAAHGPARARVPPPPRRPRPRRGHPRARRPRGPRARCPRPRAPRPRRRPALRSKR